MSIKGSNNPFPCHPVVFSSGNYIISQGTITRVDNVFTFSVGFVWTINGTIYQNTIPFVLTIPEAAAGFFRIDNALLTTSNTIELQQGLPSNSIAIRPSYPETNILLTSWNISSDTIGNNQSPIVGTDVVKKSYANMFEFNGTGANSIIPLHPSGFSEIRLINAGLTSVSGVDLSLMTGPNFESPYQGKPIIFWNRTGGNVTLNNEDYAIADYPLFLTQGSNLVFPHNHFVIFKWDSAGLYQVDKNFFSIDEIIGLTTALSLKADLVAGKVPSSQLPSYVDDVLEFANLASFPVTGETGKIYLALDTNFTYRWSGSVYLKISDTGKLDKVTSSGVERAYIINADGSQSTKPTSDFGTVKGTGTNNRISKFTAGGTIGDSQIFDNGTNVGIGTTSPLEAFHISGAAKSVLVENEGGGTPGIILKSTRSGWFQSINIFGGPSIANGQQMQFGQYDNGKMFFFNSGNFPIGFFINGSEKLSIAASGNVGIGTTSPQARLDVIAQGALATNIVFRVRNSTDTQNFLVVNGAGDVYNNGAGGVNSNTFFGEYVGRNTTGSYNSAFGILSLKSNTTGYNNSAFGIFSLTSNTTGNNNSAFGVFSLKSNTTGNNNSAFGRDSLTSNTTGIYNSAFGVEAGILTNSGDKNETSNNSVYIGSNTRANANNETNQIVIGHSARGDGSNSVVLGNSSITKTRLQGQVIIGTFTTAPTGIEGAIYYDSTTKKHYGFNGTTWNALY